MADDLGMDRGKWMSGESIVGDEPVWEPILELLGDFLTSRFFMWMFESGLGGGVTVQAYKHRVTRRYLFVDQLGRGYEWRWGYGYRQRPLPHLIEQAFEGMTEHWEERERERYDEVLQEVRARKARKGGGRA